MMIIEFDKLTLPDTSNGWLFFLGHSWTSGLAAVLLNYATMRIPPQAFGIITSADIVLLGTLQYTLLAQYVPGHGNAFEIVGVILILLSGIIQPLISLCQQKHVKDKDNEDTELLTK